MTDYPWYEVIPPDKPLTQGDIIESCPVLVVDGVPGLPNPADHEALEAAVREAAGVQVIRVIAMTQACDIEQNNVRDVILCPIYHVAAWKEQWERKRTEVGKAVDPGVWKSHLSSVAKGQTWNLTLLNGRAADEAAGMPALQPQVVDFHEIFSLPLVFVRALVQASPGPRLRLCPPYREHLSQAFARYFMRVGLPQDIEL